MNMLMITGVLLNMLASSGAFTEIDTQMLKALSGQSVEIDLAELNENAIEIMVDVTAYSPTENQTDSTPFTTASNKGVREGYIAISRDLESQLTFGDKVFIEDLGLFEVQDRMNRRWNNRVDIFFYDRDQALKFGKVKKKMWILDQQINSLGAISKK